MSLTNNELNAVLDAIGPRYAYASLHSASPGSTGTNELTGGSPAYARKAIVWDPAASQILPLDASLLFDVPAGSTVHSVGLWSAVTAGTFRGSDQLSATEVYVGQGTYELTALTITASSS
jgi:hypothetical protein